MNSPFISRYLDKLVVIPPPVEVHAYDCSDVDEFRAQYVGEKGPVIGMAARLATEKGVEYLLQALGKILEQHPHAQVLFAGQHEDVLGEAEYRRRLEPLFQRYADHWTFLGVLPPENMATFYDTCDVTVLPSVNSTESFGLVQIESMICGTPVVASNLPGVRMPTQFTGMGAVVPLRDPQGLATSIMDVLAHPERFAGDHQQIRDDYSPDKTAERYEAVFESLLAK